MKRIFSCNFFYKTLFLFAFIFLSTLSFANTAEAAVVNTATSTSNVKDFGGASASIVFSWNASTTASTSIAMKVRSGTTASPSSDSDANWTAWTSVNSGDSLSATLRANRYFQYRAILTSQDINYVPTLNDVTIIRSVSATLISSPYDSSSAANIIPQIAWTGTGTSTNVTINLQIRSGNTTTSLLAATWCGYADTGGTCTGSNYFDNSKNGVRITDLTNPLMSGGDDRYFQYKIILASDGVSTPTVTSVTASYVVNGPPEFSTSTTASQRTSDGKVLISYSALDSDTGDASVACHNCVVASFRYSINNGSSWTSIPNQYLSTPDGANQGYATTTISSTTRPYAILWDAKSQINSTYATSTKIEITLNDLEGGNNTAVTSTAAFGLDVADPALGSPSFVMKAHRAIVNGTAADLTLSATDASPNLKICITFESTSTNCTFSQNYNATSSIVLTSNPKRVYAFFRDTYMNISSVSALTPETPTNIMIKDASDLALGAYQEFVVWKAVASTTFAYYRVEYSTNGSDYTLLNSINDSSVNFYFHKGLAQGSNNFYRVYTEDTNGNTSFLSSSVSDVADGTGGTNPNPPIISNVQVIATTTQSATIEWDTNELSNSSVYYHTGSDSNLTAGTPSMTQDESHIGRHHVVLTNLTPGKTYNFTVESKNALDVSGENTNEGNGFLFDTASGPTITNVTASNVTNNSATIVWNTNAPANSMVYYTPTSTFASFENNGASGDATSHQVVLTNLSKGITYYYYVTSNEGTDDNGGIYYTFTTPVDNVAPVIDLVTTTLVTDTQALISWTTNELSDSNVVYGIESGNYNLNSEDTNLALNHRIILSGLTTSTAYYYKVISTDASGNEASSTEESTFTTLETLSQESAVQLRELEAQTAGEATGAASKVCPSGGGGGSSIDRTKPVLSEMKIENITGVSAKVSWKTDKLANSLVQYGKSTQYDFGQINTNLSTTHSVVLNGLAPLTSYSYRISSIDANGNYGQSNDFTFKTTELVDLGGPATDTTAEGTNNQDIVFTTTLDNVAEYLATMANQVSVNVLEKSLNNQFEVIRQLSNSVPPPFLSGEPRVLTTSDTATITWRTDKEANSLVALAPETKYDKTKGENAYTQVIGNSTEAVTTHAVVVSDLEPETTYHYQVRSMSGIGSLGQSSDFTFKTKNKELEISNYTIQKVNAGTATFKWLTNTETDAAVKFTPFRNGVLAVDSAQTVKNKNFTTLHEITVESFESGILYEVELSGKDIKGQIISKKISSFSTGDDNFPPTIYQVQTESALSAGKESNVQTIISWLTDEPATAQVFYQKGVNTVEDATWEKTQMDTNYSKKHIIVLTKFEPGQIYQFKLQSADSNNNVSTSKVYTVLAPKQKESVFQVIMKNFEDVFGWTQDINK